MLCLTAFALSLHPTVPTATALWDTFILTFFLGRNFTCSHCTKDMWDKRLMEARPKVFCVNATAVNCIRWQNGNAFAYGFKLRKNVSQEG